MGEGCRERRERAGEGKVVDREEVGSSGRGQGPMRGQPRRRARDGDGGGYSAGADKGERDKLGAGAEDWG